MRASEGHPPPTESCLRTSSMSKRGIAPCAPLPLPEERRLASVPRTTLRPRSSRVRRCPRGLPNARGGSCDEILRPEPAEDRLADVAADDPVNEQRVPEPRHRGAELPRRKIADTALEC